MTRAEDQNRKMLFEWGTKLFYSPEINPEVKEKIETIKEFLETSPEYNFILYFNHISFNDPGVLVMVADMINPASSRHLVVPTSYSHLDTNSIKGRLSEMGMGVVRKCGIEVLPVIQTFQINNPKYGYTEDEARNTYVKLINRFKELKNTNTPTGVLISPEGTRSEDGKMIKAESGVVAAGRLLAPVIYVPLAITYEGKYKRNGMNIGKKMDVNIGEVTIQESPRDYPSVDDLIKKLAKALPEEMRGVWG